MPPLAPTVTFDSSSLGADWEAALVECVVELELRAPGRAILRFSDPGYTLARSSTLKLATKVAISLTGGTSLFAGEVTDVGVEQREGEQPELLVTALDKSHRMSRGSNIKTYLNTTYSDVVSQLASAHSMTADTGTTSSTFDYVFQVATDLDFLNELAARSGFDWWVEGETLKFKKPSASPSASLSLGAELRSFSVRAGGHRPGSVTVYGWDRDQQQQIQAVASTPALTASSKFADLVKSPDNDFGTGHFVTAGLAATSSGEATELSQALLDWTTHASVRAYGTAAVNGAIKLGTGVTVNEAGPLDGTYPVTRVEHSYRSKREFVTRFWSGSRSPVAAAISTNGHGPLLGAGTHHSGLVVGQVTNINDPNKTGRVKVRYPGLDQSTESNWARILVPGGGANRGSVSIPEVGDEVLIGFEHGDPRQPVVLGGLFGSKSQIPLWTVKDGKVSARRMTSRLGHVFEMSDGDSNSEQYVMVQLAGGNNLLKMTQEATTLQVPSGNPITIKSGSSEISMSKDGDITLKAPNITISADQNVKISGTQVNVSADAELQMQGQSQASLKGAMLQLQGEATAALKGGIVQIN